MRKNKVKDKLNSFSYTRLYIYLGIIISSLIVYLFVISKYDPQSQIINSDKTITASIEVKENATSNTKVEEQVDTTPVTTVESDNSVSEPEKVESSSESTSPSNTENKTNQIDDKLTEDTAKVSPTEDLFPINNYNSQYSNLKYKKIVLKKGTSISSMFTSNKLPVGDLYLMLDQIGKVNKPRLEKLDVNDYILVKQDTNNKIVALAIYNKSDTYIGQVVLFDGKYIFAK